MLETITSSVASILNCNKLGMIFDDVQKQCTLAGVTLTAYSDSETCSNGRIGAMRYTTTSLLLCNGTDWTKVNQSPLGTSITNPASSCTQIVQAGSFTSNGLYYILQSSGVILQQVCESSSNRGSDGSSTIKVATSCATMKQYFGLTSNFGYVDSSGANPPVAANAVYVYCNNGVSEGGNGASIATTALTSCGQLMSRWSLGSGQYYVNGALTFVALENFIMMTDCTYLYAGPASTRSSHHVKGRAT